MISTDEQVAEMLLFRTAPVEVIMLEICPALYGIHDCTTADEIPPRLPLTYGRVNENGIYLLDTGNIVYLYVRSYASPELIQCIFGVSSFTQINENVGNFFIYFLNNKIMFLVNCSTTAQSME